MTDYRVTVKVRNARLLRAIESLGHTPNSFARANNFNPTIVCGLVAMKVSPTYASGQWRREVMAICEQANALPGDLFTARQMATLESNVVEREVDEAALVALTGHTATSEDAMLIADARRLLSEAIAELPERTQAVLEMRFGGATMEEVAKELGVTRERVRQIEMKGCRTLRRKLDRHKDSLENLEWSAA